MGTPTVQSATGAPPQPPTALPATPQAGGPSDLIGAGVLGVGTLLGRAISWAEHADFVMSLTDTKARAAFEFWNSVGWIIMLACAVGWGAHAFRNRRRAGKAITPGLLLSSTFVSFLFGVIASISASASVPNVLLAWGTQDLNVCNANLDGTKLQMFRNEYKIGTVCLLQDPTIDPLENKTAIVSNFFEIIPGTIQVVSVRKTPIAISAQTTQVSATPVPEQKQPSQQTQQVRLPTNYFVVLVPKDVSSDNINTLGDIIKVHGKILHPAYFK